MQNASKPSRLGDLLLERRAISAEQLQLAIAEQRRRRKCADASRKQSTALGEILVEFEFVDRHLLRRTLKWQRRLRRTTFALAFIAPFITTACGGSGSAQADTTVAEETQVIDTNGSPQNPPASDDSAADVNDLESNSDAADRQDEVVDPPSATLSWTIPAFREDGADLILSEIDGYEILYKKIGDAVHYTLIIDDPSVSEYVLEDLSAGEYEFTIASYDTDGVYSRFSNPIYKSID